MAGTAALAFGTVYLSMNVTDTLLFDAGLRLGSPAEVKQLVAVIEARMTELGIARTLATRYFDQLDIFADGSDMIVSLAMSGDQITQLVSMLAASATATATAGPTSN